MYSAHERGCGRQIEKETGKEREREEEKMIKLKANLNWIKLVLMH